MAGKFVIEETKTGVKFDLKAGGEMLPVFFVTICSFLDLFVTNILLDIQLRIN